MTVQTKTARSLDWQRAIRNGALRGADTGGQTSVMTMYAVASALASYANADGTSVRPACGTVAESMEANASTVQRAAKALRDNGFLEMTRKATAKAPAHYRLTLPVDLDGKALESTESVIVERAPAPADQDDAPTADPMDAWTSAEQAVTAAPSPAPAPVEPEPLDLSGVPDFYEDDEDDEPSDFGDEDEEPEPVHLGRFAAKAKAAAEQRAANAERNGEGAPPRHRPRYGNT